MKVKIANLTFFAILGILEHERKTPQEVHVDCIFQYSFKESSKEKEDGFVDYSQVAHLIEKTIKEEQFFLIEEALLRLDSLLKKSFPIELLSLTITKPTIMPNSIVSVTHGKL